MARTAFNQLQEQIEAVRKEAFAAGYAAAMQSIREFAGKPAPGAEAAAPQPTRRRRGGRRAPAAPAAQPAPAARQRRRRAAVPAPPRARRAPAGRPSRGTNARLVEEVLQANAPRALRPSEIRSAIQRDQGAVIAFTSIRHALTQLEERHAAEQVGDSKTWRIAGGGSD